MKKKKDNYIHAVLLGARGGRSKSRAKQLAARENGKKGGRPIGSKNKVK